MLRSSRDESQSIKLRVYESDISALILLPATSVSDTFSLIQLGVFATGTILPPPQATSHEFHFLTIGKAEPEYPIMFFGGDPFEHFAGMHGGPGGPGSMRGPPKDVDTTKLYETLGVSASCVRALSWRKKMRGT